MDMALFELTCDKIIQLSTNCKICYIPLSQGDSNLSYQIKGVKDKYLVISSDNSFHSYVELHKNYAEMK